MTETAKRAMADLQNFKRRTEEERGEIQVYANMRLLEAIFPALDNFARAFEIIPEDLEEEEWVKGIQGIESNLMNALAALGLDDAYPLQVDIEFGGCGLDGGAVAEEDGNAHATGDPLAGGLENARVAAFRENDAFGVPLEFFYELRDDGHRGCGKLAFRVSSVNAA